MQKSHEQLKKLLAKSDVLLAERNSKVPAASKQLITLAGGSGAKRMIAEEEHLRNFELTKRAGQEQAFAILIDSTKHELNVLRERMAHSESSLKEKAEYVKTLSALRSRGSITDVNFHLAQNELSNAREIWHSNRATLAHAERKLVEFEQQKLQIGIDAQIVREREIKLTQDAIAQEEVTQATIGNLLAGFTDAYAVRTGPRAMRFQIVRRTPAGLQQLPSNELSQ
jgi:hypothetical protein